MKFFRKTLLFLTCACLIFCYACAPTKTYNLFSGSYWLKTHEVGQIAPVNETCTYTLSVVGSRASNIYMKLDESSIFTTKLENSTYNGVACYKFSTNLSLKGSYVRGTEETPFNDTQTSECYFLGTNSKFAPLFSTKSVSTTTPFSRESGYVFATIEYKYDVTYNMEKGEATAKVVCGENTTKGYEVEEYERTFEKINATAFIDNQMLLFFPRACKFESGFYQTFNTLDVLAQTVHRMRISVNSTAPTSEISLADFSVNGRPLATSEKLRKFNTYNVLIQINSNFSGAALEFNYDATDTSDNLNTLVKYAQELPLNLGKLTYTIKSISSDQI